MLKRDDTVLVAVSGGPDSIALLHFLNLIEDEFNLKLHIFHLNHRIRGSEADEDERFVAGVAGKLGIEVTLLQYDVPALVKRERLSLEEAARQARYELMEEVARDVNASKIALGHHADDQVETFLMRLVRGAGIDGLSAMQPVRGLYVRPLLNVSKEDVLGYLKENGLDYRIDASNEDVSFLRNRVRLELLPLLNDYNPRFRSSALATIETVGEDRRYIEMLTENVFKLKAEIGDGFVSFPIHELLEEHTAVRRRLVRIAIARIKGDLRGIDFEHIEAIIKKLADVNIRFGVDLPGGVKAFSEYGKLIFIQKEKLRQASFEQRLLVAPGATTLDELGVKITAKYARVEGIVFEKNGGIAHLDVDKIRGEIAVRTRKPGDFFYPYGMKGEKKLQDFFTDIKVPFRERDRIPIIVAGDDILWVAGFRIDDRFRVTAQTRRILVLSLDYL